ncbi:TetR/AcrR family transcriptional regulator [Microbacterium resistens]|uniref:TetR/AcrR family transcriptional regulator n=1 Tax=Microbacterium resistens TaxID=156977 RepID=A0ABY3RPP9_9MICO|nr:TetR/AcrR family transcriptional regulator [Microbacterium resistens]UGS25851.1 TetR/AcrR family transcriptional regulator [Microbacterium resistens]
MPGPLPLAPDRRDALIAATLAEFDAHGYDGASLNRIIRTVGMSKSSFYHFVGSKAELFDAVIALLLDDVSERWRPPSAETFRADFWGSARAVLDDAGALTATDPALRALGRIFYLPGAPEDTGERARLLAAVRGWVGDVLDVGRETGAVRADLPAPLLADAAFAVLRTIDEWVLREERTPADAEIAERASLSLIRGLLSPDGDR